MTTPRAVQVTWPKKTRDLYQQKEQEELDLSAYGRKNTGFYLSGQEPQRGNNVFPGASTLPEKIITKTKAVTKNTKPAPVY